MLLRDLFGGNAGIRAVRFHDIDDSKLAGERIRGESAHAEG